jgi:peptidoglycan/xylan/chitin deacetylase (PgdA/CDA1 family)
MQYLAHVLRSKGLANVLPRAMAIGRNFGFTEARIEHKLAALGELTARYDAPLTACVTACLTQRYPATVAAMARRGWEIAVHGRVHCDLRQLSPERQVMEMEEALSLCRRRGVSTRGFRAPYLAWNEATQRAAARNRFSWTSNRALLWCVLDRQEHSPRDWAALERVLEHLYRPLLAQHSVSVPRLCHGVVEIPVSLPDDEILLDRLHASEPVVERHWLRILDQSRSRGELAVLLIHHERTNYFLRALEAVLIAARRQGEHLWLADLGQIAQWWRERAAFSFELGGEPGRYHVKANCSGRAAVLLKRPGRAEGSRPGWKQVSEREFTVESQVRPTIGVAPGVATGAVEFLRNEGFVVEPRQAEHALVLEGPGSFGPEAERVLLKRAEDAPGPLLRFGRWPRGIESALALSMDIDSITLLDFVKRSVRR